MTGENDFFIAEYENWQHENGFSVIENVLVHAKLELLEKLFVVLVLSLERGLDQGLLCFPTHSVDIDKTRLGILIYQHERILRHTLLSSMYSSRSGKASEQVVAIEVDFEPRLAMHKQ